MSRNQASDLKFIVIGICMVILASSCATNMKKPVTYEDAAHAIVSQLKYLPLDKNQDYRLQYYQQKIVDADKSLFADIIEEDKVVRISWAINSNKVSGYGGTMDANQLKNVVYDVLEEEYGIDKWYTSPRIDHSYPIYYETQIIFLDSHLSYISIEPSPGITRISIIYSGHPSLSPIASMLLQDSLPNRDEQIDMMNETLFRPAGRYARREAEDWEQGKKDKKAARKANWQAFSNTLNSAVNSYLASNQQSYNGFSSYEAYNNDMMIRQYEQIAAESASSGGSGGADLILTPYYVEEYDYQDYIVEDVDYEISEEIVETVREYHEPGTVQAH